MRKPLFNAKVNSAEYRPILRWPLQHFPTG